MTCDQCKHWKPRDLGWNPEYEPHMTCQNLKFLVGIDDAGNDGLYVDVFHYQGSGEISTGPKFGCVHFDQK